MSRKIYLVYNDRYNPEDQKMVATIEEARQICKEYNDTHPPGRYSRKAEFEQG